MVYKESPKHGLKSCKIIFKLDVTKIKRAHFNSKSTVLCKLGWHGQYIWSMFMKGKSEVN